MTFFKKECARLASCRWIATFDEEPDAANARKSPEPSSEPRKKWGPHGAHVAPIMSACLLHSALLNLARFPKFLPSSSFTAATWS